MIFSECLELHILYGRELKDHNSEGEILKKISVGSLPTRWNTILENKAFLAN